MALPQRLKKLQNAEVRAVQTPARLCKRCGNAVQSPRTPCGGFILIMLKPLSHQSGVHTAFPQRLKKLQNAVVRAMQTPATLCKRCGNAVQSLRTPCGGVYFGHAQNKRRGLAFAQRVRQNAVATLWGLLERRGSVVSAPRARCKDAV